MDLKSISSTDIKKMSYNELIGLVQETNRAPGGTQTLNTVSLQTRLNEHSKVLEVGTSTGISAVELARLTNCQIEAIDINEMSLEKARERAEQYAVYGNINFSRQDATCLPYDDNTYDLVFYGNVISLINDRKQGLEESIRVLKADGYLTFVPMYYLTKPTDDLLKRVSDAIQVPVSYLTKDYWTDFLSHKDTELFYQKNFKFDTISEARVARFSQQILERQHLKQLSAEARETLSDCYSKYMQLFRENLSQMGFSILIYRKNLHPVEETLFTSSEI